MEKIMSKKQLQEDMAYSREENVEDDKENKGEEENE